MSSKKVKINSKGISKMLKKHLRDSIGDVPENKIDSILREYLLEREESMDLPLEDEHEFSAKTIEAIEDMVDGLSEMVSDLEIIGEKEGNVLVDGTDYYADDFIHEIVLTLGDVIGWLESLKDVNKDPEED